MYPTTFLLSVFVTLFNGQQVPCDHPLAIAEGKGCSQKAVQILTELTPEHNVGDDVNGSVGFKWFHDGVNWVIIDCYYAIYNGPLIHQSVCAINSQPEPTRDPSNGYPVWEVGNTYYRGYPSEQFVLLAISLSPLTGKRVLTLQKTSEPFHYVAFQEDQQKEPFIKVR